MHAHLSFPDKFHPFAIFPRFSVPDRGVQVRSCGMGCGVCGVKSEKQQRTKKFSNPNEAELRHIKDILFIETGRLQEDKSLTPVKP